ncbi:hypothetical protein ACHAW5_006401 [Stephanodiscus triporus]|uniref:Uncharacterized protein n=1 Tax=Stephanodiscus triporus TaxID=2934178 RepID=A0ABD3NY11_9STRA
MNIKLMMRFALVAVAWCVQITAALKGRERQPKSVKKNSKHSKATKTSTSTSPTPCEEDFVLVDGICTHACDAGTHGCIAGTMCFKTTGADFRCLNPIVEGLIPPYARQDFLDFFHERVFDEIAADSPTGFTRGQVIFDQAPVNQELPMEFEATNSVVLLSGTFKPVSGIIPEDTRARVYSQGGLLTETILSQGGGFEITLTDIIPGRSPFILVFVSMATSTNVNQVTSDSANEPQQRRLANEGTVIFWCINKSSECVLGKSTLTFRLTWNQPNNLNLFVVEPNGDWVDENNKVGDYGELDYDNQDGFGPEHYITQRASSGQIYQAGVFLPDVEFIPVDFILEAFYDSSRVLRQLGTLTKSEEFSNYFDVTIPDDDPCEACPTESELTNVISSADEDRSCRAYRCDKIKKYPWYCIFNGWNCYDSDITNRWKVKNRIETMAANKENVLYFFMIVLTPKVPRSAQTYTPAESYFDGAMRRIREKRGDYKCLRNVLLDAYCRITWQEDDEQYFKLAVKVFDEEKDTVLDLAEKLFKITTPVYVKILLEYISFALDLSTKYLEAIKPYAYTNFFLYIEQKVMSCGFK